jgi:hypothetical protein
MKRLDAVLVGAFLVAGAFLLWRQESAAGVMALATGGALRWAMLALQASTTQEEHRRELHELRMALATLGDPDELLRKLDVLQEAADKLKRAPERLDELAAALRTTGGGLDERLKKIENFLSHEATRAALDRRGGLSFER